MTFYVLTIKETQNDKLKENNKKLEIILKIGTYKYIQEYQNN